MAEQPYKRREKRRSSMFVERPVACNDLGESSCSTETADQTSKQLEGYINKLKECKKSWILYKRQLTERVDRPIVDNYHREVSENYLDYLDEDDRNFVKNVSNCLDSFNFKKLAEELNIELALVKSLYAQDCRRIQTYKRNVEGSLKKIEILKQNSFGLKEEELFKMDPTLYPISDTAPSVLAGVSD